MRFCGFLIHSHVKSHRSNGTDIVLSRRQRAAHTPRGVHWPNAQRASTFSGPGPDQTWRIAEGAYWICHARVRKGKRRACCPSSGLPYAKDMLPMTSPLRVEYVIYRRHGDSHGEHGIKKKQRQRHPGEYVSTTSLYPHLHQKHQKTVHRYMWALYSPPAESTRSWSSNHPAIERFDPAVSHDTPLEGTDKWRRYQISQSLRSSAARRPVDRDPYCPHNETHGDVLLPVPSPPSSRKASRYHEPPGQPHSLMETRRATCCTVRSKGDVGPSGSRFRPMILSPLWDQGPGKE